MMSQGSPLHLMVAMEEIKRLRALLPQTADGKEIVVGEYYYCPKRDGVVKVQVPKIWFQIGYDYWWCEIRRSGHDPACFSTPPCTPAHDLYSTEPLAWVAWKEKQ